MWWAQQWCNANRLADLAAIFGTPALLLQVLNKKSGLVGLCGQSDVRNVLEDVKKGDERAVIALDVYVHR